MRQLVEHARPPGAELAEVELPLELCEGAGGVRIVWVVVIRVGGGVFTLDGDAAVVALGRKMSALKKEDRQLAAMLHPEPRCRYQPGSLEGHMGTRPVDLCASTFGY